MKYMCFLITILILFGTCSGKITLQKIKKEGSIPISLPSQKTEPAKSKSNPGELEIKKIELLLPLYKIGSPENNVEKNVTFLEESVNPENTTGNILLAAHSGTGPIAYFQKLDKLQVGDKISLTWKGKKELYQVYKTRKTIKNGTIRVPFLKNKKQLVLTTCMPNEKEKQWTIYAEKKSDKL